MKYLLDAERKSVLSGYLHSMIRNVIWPSRHLIVTSEQLRTLQDILAGRERALDGDPIYVAQPANVICAVHSFDHAETRRNPFPGWVRAMALAACAVSENMSIRAVPVPDTAHGRSPRFAAYTRAHIEPHTGPLSVDDTLVVSSNPEVLRAWIEDGYRVHALGMNSQLWPVPAPSLAQALQPWEVMMRLAAQDDAARDFVHPEALKTLEVHEMLSLLQSIYQDPMTLGDGELTEGRDYNVYSRAFDQGADRKWQMMRDYVRPGVIVDLGCGPGSLLAEAARDPRLRESDLHGVEVSRSLFLAAEHRRQMNGFANTHTFLHHANVLQEGLFAHASVHTTLTASLTHEIRSYGSDDDLRQLLANIYAHTADGGVFINFDVCGPDKPDQTVQLMFSTTEVRSDVSTASVHDLNEYERWVRFCAEWTGPIALNEQIDGGVRTTMRAAHEFALHKDYPDNWSSEMQEEFGGWNMQRWQEELHRAGFELSSDSRAYTNDWIVHNRLNGLQLLDEQGSSIAWPTTHCLLVAVKRLG